MPVHPNCLLPEMLVTTRRGLISIKDVIIGDYVLTHRNRYRMVRHTHKNHFEGGIHWLMGNGLTGNHPILTPDGWRDADSLKDGDKVFLSTYTPHYLTSALNDTHITHYKGFVYNLTVAEDESYTVGKDRLIVHNCVCEWEIVFEKPDLGRDEVERSKQLLDDHQARYRPLIR